MFSSWLKFRKFPTAFRQSAASLQRILIPEFSENTDRREFSRIEDIPVFTVNTSISIFPENTVIYVFSGNTGREYVEDPPLIHYNVILRVR